VLLSFFRSSLPGRLLLWLLTLQSINLSIDPPDLYHNHVAEDMSINDIESIVELVLEEICVIDDAMRETDEADNEKNKLQVRYDTPSSGRNGILDLLPDFYLLQCIRNSDLHALFISGTKPETFNPPPEELA